MKDMFAKRGWFLIIIALFSIAFVRRITLFHQVGGDVDTYIEAMDDFVSGKNPYYATIETFKHLDTNPGNKGFSYPPGFLFIDGFFYSIHLFLYSLHPCNPVLHTGYCMPLVYFWKVPILLADLGVGILLYKMMADKSKLATIVALFVWFINPFMYLKNDFITNDTITSFLMLLSLYHLGKDEVAAGASYALAIGTKSFPIFILPVMLINSSNRKKFFSAAAIVGLTLSFPFLGSVADFMTLLRGSVLVHGIRLVQGRPFLFYLSYWKNIEFFQIVPLSVYTTIAGFGGWAAVLLIRFKGWIKDKYALSVIPFLVFYMFTPVLNRTYLLWFLPVFIPGLFNVTHGYTSDKGQGFFAKIGFKRAKYLYYIVLIAYWMFYYWYLAQWKDGFHIHARV